MTSAPDPALLAQLDQDIATITACVDRYARQVRESIEAVGYEPAVAAFHAFLRAQPAAPVAALAGVAIARLAQRPGEDHR